MKANQESVQEIIRRITDIIDPKYFHLAELIAQETKQGYSLLIHVENNPWRNGAIKGNLAFCKIKTTANDSFLLFKSSFAEEFKAANMPFGSTQAEAKSGLAHVSLGDFIKALEAPSEPFKTLLERVYLYNISFTPFGCCSRWAECKASGLCCHPDQLYATACQFQRIISKGAS